MPKKKGGVRPGAGRPRGVPNRATRPVKELAADFSESSILSLVWLRDHATSEQVRLGANIAILDRAHGRPRQEIDLSQDDKIVVIVNRDRPMPPATLPAQPSALEDHSNGWEGA